MALENQSSTQTLKQQLFDYVRLQLGDQIVDLSWMLNTTKQLIKEPLVCIVSGHRMPMKKATVFWSWWPMSTSMTLPQEVITVRQIFRRTFGDSTGPFAS
jgi:hypothetical protein